MKVLIIRVILTDFDYAQARKIYSDSEIRQIIAEGGEGELGQLVNRYVDEDESRG